MRKLMFFLGLLVLLLAMSFVGGMGSAKAITPTPSATFTPLPTITPTWTLTPSPLPSNTVFPYIVLSASSAYISQPVTVTAYILTINTKTPVPSMDVNVYANNILLGSGVTDQAGQVNVTEVNMLMPGSYMITAVATNANQLGYIFSQTGGIPLEITSYIPQPTKNPPPPHCKPGSCS